MNTVRQYLKRENITQWARDQQLAGGDLMYASELFAQTEDRRDATFVRVCMHFASSVCKLTLKFLISMTYLSTAMHTFAVLLRIGRRSPSMASSDMSSSSSCLLRLNLMMRTTPCMSRQLTCLLVSIHAMLTRETH